ncbi:MAG TPA: Lon family ATP-dependent protease [Candidatus Baltobacteraceae bacterium]|nr:Lon family ATP-dependent protease [Candidatus Baltobacteraceae bacterium]
MTRRAEPIGSAGFRRRHGGDESVQRQIAALYELLASTIGADKVVLRAGKLNALKLMRSSLLPERILALQRLVFEDPSIERLPIAGKYAEAISEIEDALADLIAQRNVEERLDRKVNAKMTERHEEYLKDLKRETIREDGGPETNATKQRLAEIEGLESRRLGTSALTLLRPRRMDEVVGQERAIRSLLAKLGTPYPQHTILYGPPGVGKTTVARLALELAASHGNSPFAKDAAFVEVSGTTLRWDPREATNPLLGSVHDPIYQGGRRDFAEGGIPEPKLGLVTRAHGGVLFIDEIGELDPMMQTRLLKVLEDKRVTFESSYYDENDPSVPEYVKRLFRNGAPADFLLIGATTREPDEIDAALRSRCAEVFFDPLDEVQIRRIVVDAAKRLNVRLERGIAEMVASYTIEGRRAVQILADAYGRALQREAENTVGAVGKRKRICTILAEDLTGVLQDGRLVPHTPVRARRVKEIGKTFGLGVARHLGSLIECEAVAFRVERRRGSVRFNETAGSMAKDSVFNASSVLRKLLGIDPLNYDLHVNIVGGGNIDGPSAGLAIFTVLYSALTRTRIPQDVALTGEVSIGGMVRPVGGLSEKIQAARAAGMRAVIVPQENLREIERHGSLEVYGVTTVEEALTVLGIRRKNAKARA